MRQGNLDNENRANWLLNKIEGQSKERSKREGKHTERKNDQI